MPVYSRPRPAVWPWLTLLVLSLGVVGAIAWDLWHASWSLSLRSRTTSASPRPAPMPLSPEQRRLRLFYPETASRLFREVERTVPRGATLAAEIRAVLAELSAGEEHGEPPPVPGGVQVRHVFLDGFGILYLDLSKDFRAVLARPHPQPELAVAAVVNSLTASFSEVKRVQILLEGQEVPIVVDALDLGHPLSPYFPAAEAPAIEASTTSQADPE